MTDGVHREGYQQWYYQRHRRIRLAKAKETQKEIKLRVVRVYSGGTMRCANPFGLHDDPVTDIDLLAVDHINGGGKRQLESLGISGGYQFYQWIVRNGFPPGFQILCHNCNWKKRLLKKELYRVQEVKPIAL